MSEKASSVHSGSPSAKRSRLGTVLRSASKIATQNVQTDTSTQDTTAEDPPAFIKMEEESVDAEVDPGITIKVEPDAVGSDNCSPAKKFYLRRQPKRFVHARPFTNGLADNATAEWLKEHFHAKSGSLIPKGFLCERYEEFCTRTNRKPMNNATLGRFIRGVFPKLETRRLGARQQSRYFYNNLGIRQSSPYAALIRMEMRTVNIRRNRLQKTHSRSASPLGFEPEQEAKPQLPARIPVKIPPYLPGFTQRRLAYTSFSVGENAQQRLEEALQRFDDEGCAYLLATVEQNKGKIRQMIHPSLLNVTTCVARFSSSPLPADMSEVQVSRFLVALRSHIGILSSVFLSYNIPAIPRVLENFWLDRKKSLQVFETMTFAPLIWTPLHTFIAEVYRHLYENIVDMFIADYLVPLDEHVWGILFVVANKYCQCMEFVTTELPTELKKLLVDGAMSFSQYLRDLLNANHDACYISLICMDKNAVSLLTDAITQIVRLELLQDGICWLERFALVDLLTALQTFVSFSDIKRDAVTAWANWIKGLVLSYIDRYSLKDDKLTTLQHLSADWCLFMTAAEEAIAGFHGDMHIKAGFFAMCMSMFDMVVLSIMKELYTKSAIEIYEKFANQVLSDGTEINQDVVNSNWWPDFPRMQSMSTAEDILHHEGFVRSFASLSGVVYDIEESQMMEGVRTSHRAGKGRNRWLMERDLE